jgi:hypothetical protein
MAPETRDYEPRGMNCIIHLRPDCSSEVGHRERAAPPGHSKITMTAPFAHSLADVKISAECKLDLAAVCPAANSNRTSNSPDVIAESAGNSLAA